MPLDPNVAAMMTHLAELAIPSATATFYNKVETITKGRANEQTVNELKQVINDLIKERNDLVAIAQACEQELLGQNGLAAAGQSSYDVKTTRRASRPRGPDRAPMNLM